MTKVTMSINGEEVGRFDSPENTGKTLIGNIDRSIRQTKNTVKGNSMSALKTKVEKKYPDFVEEVERLSVAELEHRLIGYAKNNAETEKARENDEELQKAKDTVKYLNEPYKDAIAAIKDKTKYILTLIEEKGGEV